MPPSVPGFINADDERAPLLGDGVNVMKSKIVLVVLTMFAMVLIAAGAALAGAMAA